MQWWSMYNIPNWKFGMLQCNAMFFSQLSYMWIMHRHVARHHICELSDAIFFFHYVFDNMCILNYSSCVSTIWAGYGKIRSENKVFRAGNGTWAYISMVTGSSSEEETDDQSYIPPEVYALSCNVYISHIMHMVSCSA